MEVLAVLLLGPFDFGLERIQLGGVMNILNGGEVLTPGKSKKRKEKNHEK